MKILMVISQFYPMVGGAEKQAQLLARKLIEKGIEVNVVTGWWSVRTKRREIVDGISVTRNFALWGMFGIKGLRVLGALTYMFTLAIYLLLKGRSYDLVHVHQALYPAFVTVLVAGRILHKPVVVKAASAESTSDITQLKRFPFGTFQLKYLLKRMEHLIAVSRKTGEEFTRAGFPQQKIRYIPNGVSYRAGISRRVYEYAKSVITISRLSWEKGIDVLLRAWSYVLEEEGDLVLQIVGSGPVEQELKSLSTSLGIDGKVVFTGFSYDVARFLSDADIFVLPSRAEGISNALLEAMSDGLPCVATNVGGNSELLQWYGDNLPLGKYAVGQGGVIVNSEDADGLSQALLALVRNKGLREMLGRNAAKIVKERYTIDNIANEYVNLYTEIMEKRP